MDTFEAIATKLDVKEYDLKKSVPPEVKLKVLEAARLTGSGVNSQHWRFILVQDRAGMKKLADDSMTGKWVEWCSFAVIVLADPTKGYHLIDAGRVLQDMQLAAWNYGVASRLFSGLDANRYRQDFEIPEELSPTVVVGFGYPAKKITGKRKKRVPLEELAFLEKYGNKLDRSKLT
ncbi:MAG: nitroreductase family protein [Thaumarchaeota archaeon]|nr:nitroreductase family protein [Nitrososphaerota archaeon]